MRAGSLRHRITIQQPVVSPNTIGEPLKSWATLAIVWASVEPIRGKEVLQAEQILADMDTRIRMRWSQVVDSMTARCRIVHKGKIYNVKQISHLALRHREIEVMANSGLNEE